MNSAIAMMLRDPGGRERRELIDDDDAKMSQRQKREEGQFGIGFWKIGISFNI